MYRVLLLNSFLSALPFQVPSCVICEAKAEILFCFYERLSLKKSKLSELHRNGFVFSKRDAFQAVSSLYGPVPFG